MYNDGLTGAAAPMDYAQEKMAMQMSNPGTYIPPTDRQKLQEKKRVLESELRNVNEALTVLDAHPDLEEFTKVLQRGLR